MTEEHGPAGTPARTMNGHNNVMYKNTNKRMHKKTGTFTEMDKIRYFCYHHNIRTYGWFLSAARRKFPKLCGYALNGHANAVRRAIRNLWRDEMPTMLDRVQSFCYRRGLFTYDAFLASARKKAPDLAAYAEGKNAGPERRRQILEAIRDAENQHHWDLENTSGW